MDDPKLDKRILKTRMQLKEALIRLILDSPYSEISIQDVTKAAEIGYRTFFRHYESIDDLLIDLVEGEFDDLVERMVPLDLSIEPAESGRRLFESIGTNKEMYAVLFRSHALEHIYPQIVAKVRTLLIKQNLIPIHKDARIYTVVGSIFGLIRWWLEQDELPDPIEMGELYAEMIALPNRDRLIEALQSVSNSTGDVDPD